MKVRKLKDRHGEVFTPLVHKDSVIDVNGVPLKNWISPIAINGVDAGYSSKTDIVDGTHITISNVRVADTDGSYHNQVKATHNNIKRTDIPATGNPSSGDTVEVISAMTSDPQGHVLTVTTKTVTFPLDTTITPSDKVIYLTGTEDKSGVNRLKSADSATYSPTTKRLKALILEGNFADGSKGSIPYQTDADSTQYLEIGTSGQILSVSADGVPSWIDKVNGLLGQAWTDGTTQGPVPTFSLENGTGKFKTLTGVAVPSATASTSGVVNTTTQSFSGDKTFTGTVVVEEDLTVKGNIVYNGSSKLTDELSTIKTDISTHKSNTKNPHSVTKAQVGLGNADNTADSEKKVLSALKLTVAKTVTLQGAVTGTVSTDFSKDTVISTSIGETLQNAIDSHLSYADTGETASITVTTPA